MSRTLLSRDPAEVAAAARVSNGLSVVFKLDRTGAITDDALVLYDGEALASMPVWLLPQLAAAFPEADTRALHDAVAKYQAERRGLRGRA